MKELTFTAEEIKEKAMSAMENCIAYLSKGRIRAAITCYGSVSTWVSMLVDLSIDLEEEDEHFKEMYDEYADFVFNHKIIAE